MIGYARVSIGGQRLDRQTHALTEAGCIRIFADKKSGKNIDREELWKALDHLRPGDTLVVPSLDRLGRSLQDLIAIVASIARLLGVSRATIDKYVPELKTDQRPQLEPGPQTTRVELPAG